MSRKKCPTLCLLCALYARQFASGTPVTAQDAVSPAEARAIAKEAYIYGFPMVDGYRIQYAYFVDRKPAPSPAFALSFSIPATSTM